MEHSASRASAEEPSGYTADKSAYHEATGDPARSAGGNACERNQEGSEGELEACVGLHIPQLFSWDPHVLPVARRPPHSLEGTNGKGTFRLGGLVPHGSRLQVDTSSVFVAATASEAGGVINDTEWRMKTQGSGMWSLATATRI